MKKLGLAKDIKKKPRSEMTWWEKLAFDRELARESEEFFKCYV